MLVCAYLNELAWQWQAESTRKMHILLLRMFKQQDDDRLAFVISLSPSSRLCFYWC